MQGFIIFNSLQLVVTVNVVFIPHYKTLFKNLEAIALRQVGTVTCAGVENAIAITLG